jgi:hypothetical protein
MWSKMTAAGSVSTPIDSLPSTAPVRIDQILEKEMGSVPHPRQTKRAATANANEIPTHKSHRRIVSVAHEETGNAMGGEDWSHLPDSLEVGEMISGGILAMGFINTFPLWVSTDTTAQPTHGERNSVLRPNITTILPIRFNSAWHRD